MDAIVCADSAAAAVVSARIDTALGYPIAPTLADVKGATGRVKQADLVQFATTTNAKPVVNSDGIRWAVPVDSKASAVLSGGDAAAVTKNLVWAVAAPAPAQAAPIEEAPIDAKLG